MDTLEELLKQKNVELEEQLKEKGEELEKRMRLEEQLREKEKRLEKRVEMLEEQLEEKEEELEKLRQVIIFQAKKNCEQETAQRIEVFVASKILIFLMEMAIFPESPAK